MTDPVHIAGIAYLEQLSAYLKDENRKDMPEPPSPEVAIYLSNMATNMALDIAEFCRARGIPVVWGDDE